VLSVRHALECSGTLGEMRTTRCSGLVTALLIAAACGHGDRAAGPEPENPSAPATPSPSAPAGGPAASGEGSASGNVNVDAELSSLEREMGAFDQDLSGADDSLKQTEEEEPGG
jgi:hypothetical protein